MLRLAALTLSAALALSPALAQTKSSHALSLVGEPKYGPDFKQLDYVNPGAPKGGEVKLVSVGGFDNLNPFIPKGDEAPGLGLIYETLMTSPLDDVSAEYGLIAESVEVPDDLKWVSFKLRAEAKWADGKPITAEDVAYTFLQIKEKGEPTMQYYYANVTRAEVLGPKQIKFHFDGPPNRELPQIMGQLPVIQKAQWEKRDFDKVTLDPWTGSGPYRIKEFEANRFIVYERRTDWWGKDLAIAKGRYNFDRIRYDIYRDNTVTLEAFKSGQYDYRSENIARVWATGYDFPARQNGLVKLEKVKHERPGGLSGFIFNTRREKFADPRLREALGYTFDFEWANKNFFFGEYSRTESFFQNSDFAARGEPSPAELKLLEPLRAQLPPRVFGPAYKPPSGDGSGADRNNLRKARELLAEAGYTVKDGKLVDKAGKPFEIEMLLVDPAFERIAAAWGKSLERLGVKLNLRVVDSSQYTNRIRAFDFDMISGGWGQSNSPGNEQRSYWTTAAADNPANRNLAGIKSPAIDTLVDAVIYAKNRDELVSTTRALDRALTWGFYVIPGWTFGYDRIAYWDKFGKPEKSPSYGNDFMSWWVDAAKDAKLREAKP